VSRPPEPPGEPDPPINLAALRARRADPIAYRHAWGQLYNRYTPELVTLALYYVRRWPDPDDEAAEIVQRAWIRVLPNEAALADIADLRAYLATIVLNEVRRTATQWASETARRQAGEPPVPPTPDDIAGAALIADAVLRRFESEPEDAQQLWTLRMIEGLSWADIAHQMGLTDISARARFSRLRRRLLQDVWPPPDGSRE
jgi:RNA polymerase sigma factor (sigma-70 family)